MDLTDKLALVTGSAVRVGRAIALELARAGCHVVVHYRRSGQEAERTAEAIRALGRRALIVAADLAQPEQACAALLSAADRLGPLDVLVNNAAVYEPGTVGQLPPDQWARMMAINATAPTLLAERVAEAMTRPAPNPRDGGPRAFADAPVGSIVNVLDIQASRPRADYLAYAQTKAALWSATLGLARRFAPSVRVNGVAPGTVLWGEQDGEDVRRRVIERIPLARVGRPEDVAASVRFLCENDYITGQVLRVDGGRSM